MTHWKDRRDATFDNEPPVVAAGIRRTGSRNAGLAADPMRNASRTALHPIWSSRRQHHSLAAVFVCVIYWLAFNTAINPAAQVDEKKWALSVLSAGAAGLVGYLVRK